MVQMVIENYAKLKIINSGRGLYKIDCSDGEGVIYYVKLKSLSQLVYQLPIHLERRRFDEHLCR